MPFGGFQHVVNGWIKVNSKHPPIVRPDGTSSPNSNGDAKETALENNSSNTHLASNESVTVVSVSSEKTRKSKRAGNNQSRRRSLRRTVSHTDLLREMAIESQQTRKSMTFAETYLGVESQRSDGSESTQQQQHHQQHSEKPVESASQGGDDALRFVAGFFGADLAPPPPPPKQPPPPPQPSPVGTPRQHLLERKPAALPSPPLQQQHLQSPRISHPLPNRPLNTGRYINEAIFFQQFEQKSSRLVAAGALEPTNYLRRTDSIDSRESSERHGSISALSTPPPPGSALRAGTPPLYPSRSVGGGVGGGDDATTTTANSRIQTTPKLNAPQNMVQQFFKNFPSGRTEDLEHQLLAASADKEYLRSVALRNEYQCKDCKQHQFPPLQEQQQQALSEQHVVSQRLKDLTAALHLQQQLNSQPNMQLESKVSRFARVCHDLDQDSALRRQEAFKLEEALAIAKGERDALALEVEELRASMAHHTEAQIEFQAVKATLQQYEETGIAQANAVLERRDELIRKLSVSLKRALEAVEVERIKQRQRRQIFFSSRSASLPSAMPYSEAHPSDELRQAKEEALSANAKLDFAQTEAARVEVGYKNKIRQLEQELKLARASSSSSSSDANNK